MEHSNDDPPWQSVLEYWFPEGRQLDVDPAVHGKHWQWRMRGGADQEVVACFSPLAAEGALGRLDAWAAHPEGRLALIIVLDQFSRSVWRGSARAFAQDPAALALALEGLGNGHYEALTTPWFKLVYGLPLGHCEGQDHLDRLNLLVRLREEIAAEAPVPLQPFYRSLERQAQRVREVIARFGRHPHRNALLDRPSTPEEEAYIARGEFPHRRDFRH